MYIALEAHKAPRAGEEVQAKVSAFESRRSGRESSVENYHGLRSGGGPSRPASPQFCVQDDWSQRCIAIASYLPIFAAGSFVHLRIHSQNRGVYFGRHAEPFLATASLREVKPAKDDLLGIRVASEEVREAKSLCQSSAAAVESCRKLPEKLELGSEN